MCDSVSTNENKYPIPNRWVTDNANSTSTLAIYWNELSDASSRIKKWTQCNTCYYWLFNKNGILHSNHRQSHCKRNSWVIPSEYFLISWSFWQHCLWSWSPFYLSFLRKFTQDIGDQVPFIYYRTSIDRWPIWSYCQNYSDAYTTFCISRTGLGNPFTLPWICIQRYSAINNQTNSVLFELWSSSERNILACRYQESSYRRSHTISDTTTRSSLKCNQRCSSSTSEICQ